MKTKVKGVGLTAVERKILAEEAVFKIYSLELFRPGSDAILPVKGSHCMFTTSPGRGNSFLYGSRTT